MSGRKRKEAEKVSDCIASLDALIALEEKKILTLKSLKKMLQTQLTVQPGETVPRLRFPEFREGGS